MKTKLFALTLGLSLAPFMANAEIYKESFECHFGRGIVNKPTPRRLVFSVDEFGRFAFVHAIEIRGVDTKPGPGRVKRDSPKQLSIAWVGQEYVYSDTGRSYASNESRIDALDLRDQEFSVLLDRKSMKATARSSSNSAYLPRDGFARGKCAPIAQPKG